MTEPDPDLSEAVVCYLRRYPGRNDEEFHALVPTQAGRDAINNAIGTFNSTAKALDAAISWARPGNRLGDISNAIGEVAREAGLSVNLQFGGHGVGRTMHGDPHVANDGRPGRGFKLKPGLVIAIEPWFMHTTDEIYTDPDGWTLRSADRSRGAHMEHTVAITPDGPQVLTARG